MMITKNLPLVLGFILVLVISLPSVSLAETYGGGNGTAAEPYEIWTPEQMNTIGLNPGDWGKHFKLMVDIDMSAYTGTQYNIIGNSTTKFIGVFDGNGHVISNLTYTTIEVANYVGLFGYVSGNTATIKNLGVEKVSLTTGGSYVGGLVAMNVGTITSCYATGSVSGYWYIGGLVGYNSSGTVTSCYAEGTVIGSVDYVGGLVGSNYGTITACFATGAVTGSGSYVGGLVGDNNRPITSCYATGSVTGSGSYVGGLAGDTLYGNITACYATGSVIGSVDFVGGLVGYMGRDFHSGTVTSCYATGSVSGDRYVGGLVGYIYSGTVTSCYAIGSVSGDRYVGGLVGTGYDRGTIKYCYATGFVSGNDIVGGLVGGHSITVTTCFWDMQTTGQADSSDGRGLTTEQMKTLSIYQNAGWADKGWIINDGADYPRLSWENTGGVPIPSPQAIPLTGSGTAEDPYLISTAQEFSLLSWYTDVIDKHIQLTANLDLSGIPLYSIGDLGGSVFNGVFDGNGHTLSNGVISQPKSAYVGLFSRLGSSGQIMNLGIENVNISGSNYVGGLVGYNSSGSITTCFATGAVTGSGSYVGGLVGFNSTGTVTSCYAEGTVSGSDYVGGLVGTNSGTISACYATGSLSGSGSYVGGLVGSNGGTITACYSTGTVNGSADYVGGLVGKNSGGTITVCYATGTVNGPSDVGGLVGSNSGTLTDCYATGAVEAGGNSVGGLVGTNSGTITACYAAGSVSGSGNYAGGLVGRNGGTITSCYATSSVSGNGKKVGGLVGTNSYGTIMSCYASGSASGSSHVGGLVGENYTGTITACYATGSVSGSDSYSYVGGLVGINYGNLLSCYATGTVSGSGYVGPLVGDNDGTITACFWDMQTSGRTYSFSGKGLTTEQMKTLSIFQNAGWADRGWVINNGVDYPRLSWENTDGVPIPPAVIPFVGSGTTEDPYLISTAQEFSLLSWYMDVIDKHIQLTANLDLSGVPLYPIGDLGAFSGVFDGNAYTISNAVINQLGSDYHVGLFSIVGLDGQILNLGVENVNITGGQYVGGLAGLNLGTVTACYSTGVVDGSAYVGGLVGQNNDGTITSCYATCSVSGSWNVGGLVGENNEGTIASCYATGSVSSSSEYSYVGGLVGKNGGTITACYSTGTVNGRRYVGGLAGYNYRNLMFCYASGTIRGYFDVGGLVGYNYQGRVIYCYSVAQRPMWYDLGGLCGNAKTGGDYEDTGNFWDINKSNTTISAMGIGKTTTELQTLSTFISAGWDFTNEISNGTNDIWRMCTDGMVYPHLNWESIEGDFVCPDGVDTDDFLYYVNHWLIGYCSPDNNYCGGADLNYSGAVDLTDFAIFAENWVKEDKISDHVFMIEMSLSYDFGEGYASSVPVDYGFDAWMHVDDTVISGTIRTPGGTVYPAEMETDDNENWLGIHRVSKSLAALADFTDGEYIFTVIYANGTSQSTTIPFTAADGSPLTVPPRPLLTTPVHNSTNIPLSVTFKLDPSNMTNPIWTYGLEYFPASGSGLEGEYDNLPNTTTIVGPVDLSPDTEYEIELTANHAIWSTNEDGIPYVVDNDSEVEIQFTTVSEP